MLDSLLPRCHRSRLSPPTELLLPTTSQRSARRSVEIILQHGILIDTPLVMVSSVVHLSGEVVCYDRPTAAATIVAKSVWNLMLEGRGVLRGWAKIECDCSFEGIEKWALGC